MLLYLLFGPALVSDCLAYQLVISVTTGSKQYADTNDPVYIQIFGSEGDSRLLRLNTNANDFEKGKTGEFHVIVPDIGDLHYIKMSRLGTNGWFLEKVEMARESNSNSSVKHVFQCSCWVEDNGFRLVYPSWTTNVKWKVIVRTGTHTMSGTSDAITLEIAGTKSSSPPFRLDNGRSNYLLSDSLTNFYFTTADNIGEPRFITINHHGTDGLYLLGVELVNEDTDERYKVSCWCWLDNHASYHMVLKGKDQTTTS